CCQRDMGFEEVGGDFDESLEIALRLGEILLRQAKGSDLIAHAQVARAHLQSMFEKRQRLIISLLLLQDDSQVQVRIEVVGIDGELCAKGLLSLLWIRGVHQGTPVN